MLFTVRLYTIHGRILFSTLLDAGGGLARPHPPSVFSATILWGMHRPIPIFLNFTNYIPTFIWQSHFLFVIVISTKKLQPKIFLALKKNDFLTKMISTWGQYLKKPAHQRRKFERCSLKFFTDTLPFNLHAEK